MWDYKEKSFILNKQYISIYFTTNTELLRLWKKYIIQFFDTLWKEI